ncbi:glycosyltransferase family 4 protein [Polynucleobacter paneuropaeus]|uniref:Glycosyl transferase n=1 Tax=Polynucleobacter paneuropaeus TaxID=2527775 RepID=A0A2Z4JQX5_9BURK|nr:glycosyltransferase family 4 protein [Polynucleobacter paneuropaeus]AWW49201.1 glycosyl transferase [Polynucleobacter paneuropaeus]
MNVTHLSHSDSSGGAARAAYRIHRALLDANLNSSLLVDSSTIDDSTVSAPYSSIRKLRNLVAPQAVKFFRKFITTSNLALHSPCITPSARVVELNNSPADIVHLHWIAWEMLSISDIGKIKKPIVWTLHDMWAFCGAEHVTPEFRWREGYHKNNRPYYEGGFDLNRWTWKRKVKHWSRPMHIVAPSSWLGQCAMESQLMRDWPISVIHNPLNLNIWSPVPKNISRTLLGLPQDIPLVMFGAMGGGLDPNKGFDLLIDALRHLSGEGVYFEVVIFGQSEPPIKRDLNFVTHYLGHLNDDLSLRLAYSAADLMVVPSRIESFGQTASEAHACGTPVVAFNIGGLRDIVDHKSTGYLAEPYDTIDLAAGINFVLKNSSKSQLGLAARIKAERCFDAKIISKKYRDIYSEIIK